MSRKVKIFFTLSVLLNVLLLGTGAGYMYKKWHHSPWQEWEEAKNNLSPESKKVMVANYQKMREDMKPLVSQMQDARKEIRIILTDKQFDQQKFDEVVNRFRRLRQEMGNVHMNMTRQMLAQLSPEDRIRVAEYVVGSFEWRRHKREQGREQHLQPPGGAVHAIGAPDPRPEEHGQ